MHWHRSPRGERMPLHAVTRRQSCRRTFALVRRGHHASRRGPLAPRTTPRPQQPADALTQNRGAPNPRASLTQRYTTLSRQPLIIRENFSVSTGSAAILAPQAVAT